MRRNTRFRTASAAAAAALILAVAGGVAWRWSGRPAPAAHAQVIADCSQASLTGSFGFAERGTVLIGASGHPEPSGSLHLDFVEDGRSVFDGQGGVTLTTDTRNVAGQTTALTGSGTYTVNPDCTGTNTVTLSDGTVGHDVWVLIKSGTELRVIGADPGVVRMGTATRQ